MNRPNLRKGLLRFVFAATIASTSAAATADSFIKCVVTWSTGGSSNQYFKLSETGFAYLSTRMDRADAWVPPCEAMFHPGACSVTVTREFYRATAPVHLVSRNSVTISINRMDGSLFMDLITPNYGTCEKTSDPLPANRPQKF